MDDFELVIVVNGPEEEQLVPRLEKAYAHDYRVRVIGTPVHFLNFSLTLGLHLANAPLVARMDADDISYPHRLSRQLDYMQAHPHVAVLGSSYELMDEQGKVLGRVDNPSNDLDIRGTLHYRNPICHPSVMLRRDAVLSVGGYLGGKNAEDYDLWVRLAATPGWRFANLNEPLMAYNASPAGQARRSRTAYANVAAVQWREFLIKREWRWLWGALLTAVKSFALSKKA
jgi:glycosyltransferase involved in cell wall biosynthesis